MKNVPTAPSKVKQYRSLVESLVRVIEGGRVAAARVVNQAMTTPYWLVGHQIVEHGQSGARRAGYGEELIERLSQELTARFGRGFSPRNLEQMRKFYLWKPLPWSHYSRLLSVRQADARAFYEDEAIRGLVRPSTGSPDCHARFPADEGQRRTNAWRRGRS